MVLLSHLAAGHAALAELVAAILIHLALLFPNFTDLLPHHADLFAPVTAVLPLLTRIQPHLTGERLLRLLDARFSGVTTGK
jgi:hypothetical protein